MPPREGAFAEWVAMPERNLVTVPDDVPLAKAALAEPIACGWHAVRLGLAVQGQAATLRGAGDRRRRDRSWRGAEPCGAGRRRRHHDRTEPGAPRPSCARNAARTRSRPTICEQDDLFDIVLDGVGYAATRATASKHARPGGVILHIGLGEATGGLDIRRMTLQEITFIGTYTYTAAGFPRHRAGDLRRASGAAGLDRNPRPERRGSGVQGHPVGQDRGRQDLLDPRT